MPRLAIALLAAATGCLDAPPLHEDDVVQVRTDVRDVLLFGPETHDVLVVVDSSPAMAAHRDEVQALARAIPTLLEHRPYGIPELNLAVTTSDPAHLGELTTGTAQLGGRYLTMNRVGDGTWYADYRGDFADALAQMLDVGAAGAPGSVLSAMVAALRANATTGFLRPGAPLPGLTVIVLSAGDDLGTATPESYRQALAAIDPRAGVIVVHAGDAPRLSAFAGSVQSAHQDHQLAEPPATALGGLASGTSFLELMCAYGVLRDVAPATPGIQPSCAAEIDTEATSLAIPACTEGDRAPCYAVFTDALCDGDSPQQLRLDFRNVGPYRPGRALLECESGR